MPKMEERERKECVPFPFLSRSLPGTSLVHTRECEVLVKDIKCNKFTMSWAKCSLSPPRGFGHSECLAEEGRTCWALEVLLERVFGTALVL